MAADQSETTAKPKAVNSMAIKLRVNKRSGKIIIRSAMNLISIGGCWKSSLSSVLGIIGLRVESAGHRISVVRFLESVRRRNVEQAKRQESDIHHKEKQHRIAMAADQSETTAKPKAVNSMAIKLRVNKRSGKIMYAEAGKDFVDLLFSFLVLPTGAIGKQALVSKDTKEEDDTKVCCIKNLYKSVESLPASLMKGDKAVLLDPKVVSTTYTNDILRIESPSPATPPKYYACSNTGSYYSGGSYSSTHNLSTQSGTVMCSCGSWLSREVKLVDKAPVPVLPTGFVKKGANFVITDDLNIIPINSTDTIIQLWTKLDVREPTELEERNATLGPNEVLGLLKAALVSNTALNDVFKAQPKFSVIVNMDTTGISLQELLTKLLTEGQKNRSSNKMAN